ncbi:MAG: phosphatase PAP2 family protein [Epsilonproteobacteria bacterium]|nr:phosphatase PAP2 family protein [Campylobacterota bacterium]
MINSIIKSFKKESLSQKALPIFLYLNFALISYFFIDKTIALYFHREKFLNPFFEFITFFGRSELYLVTSLLIFLIFKSQKAKIVFLSVAFSGILTDILKVIVGRYRPDMLFEKGLYGFDWFHIKYEYISFPSGHAATAFSLFVALSSFFPRYKIALFILASLIAFSRVELNAHYLSDIIVGSLIGVLSAEFILKRAKKN